MKWIELTVEVSAEKVDEISRLFGRYGQGGAIVEEQQLAGNKTFLVKIYILHTREYKAKRQQIDQSLSSTSNVSSIHLTERPLKPADWLDPLKQHFRTLEIGKKFIIKPSWADQPFPVSDRIGIELDPGAAFGTGLHPTTRLCLLRLEKHHQPGISVLDLGTGSGILTIAAAKLGVDYILALDIDPVAVRSARINAERNEVSDRVQIKRGTLSTRAQRIYRNKFDLVLANITSRAISDLSPAFARVLKPGGKLIVSGIHPQGLDEVLINLALADFSLEAIDREEQWHSVLALKPE